ncbi:uncharacterized protein MONBRDRAFT_19144 [Monosiga brevicollis MX1]|uniref:RING-type E3 ubiquitin transferase n=1 Tax=Monosiga brevicollis TaxID=81824 RepID=A9UPP3_MONBE|nr:uncharacterized protein MONBRDRAFT_19144 [Monosiga brevicollis MX1]EDQ92458.1 predicted protein [Monosiga brevicollis MX1]|eukprot:XP_001742220.1 hypothetical protein [Monosiga brevicollis MX1]
MLLINECTHYIDEVHEALGKIKVLQAQLQQSEWDDSNRTREEAEKYLAENENMAVSYANLSTESVTMLSYLTEAYVDPFLRDEVVGRLAGMLSSTIRHVVGPHAPNLDLLACKKYEYNPPALLLDVIKVYLHAAQLQSPTDRANEHFLTAMYKDARFDLVVLRQAATYLRGFGMPSDIIDLYLVLLQQAEALQQSAEDEEANLGDVPEEYLDPIMFDLMRDPVRLPSSGVVMDRSSIIQHLLSDPIDPYSRKPLTPDQLEPVPELKAEIEAWIQAQKSKANASSS